MSPRDVVAELQAARVEAPPELRDRVRLLAVAAPAGPRRRPDRRWLAVLVPAAAALAAAGVVLTRPAHQGAGRKLVAHGEAAVRAPALQEAPSAVQAVPASPGRVQRYGASLSLRVPSSADVSDAVKRALRIAASLGGHAASVHVSSSGASGSAALVLKVPRVHVQEAIVRLSQLGTITGEQVDVQDLQPGIDATDRTIARLQRQLAALRAQQQTPSVEQQIAAITARVVALQRARAATIRSAHFATIRLAIATHAAAQPHRRGHGPLHGLGVAFRWIGIGAVYALALGVPALVLLGLVWFAVRALRRRREDALLARP